MNKDIKVVSCRLYFCPVKTRVPLKFGTETTTQVLCARTEITVAGQGKREAAGWGETPLSVAWVWPSSLSYEYRLRRLKEFCVRLSRAWGACHWQGHPLEIGKQFIDSDLRSLWEEENRSHGEGEEMPWLAALVCNSLFDIAVHDAYGIYHRIRTWDCYTGEYMNRDLSWYYTSEFEKLFSGRYPGGYLVSERDIGSRIRVWHLVGAKDVVNDEELSGGEPDDGYPVKLEDWINRDGLKCLKIKLSGVDAEWDYRRLLAVGRIALKTGVEWLSTDFNCTVTDPLYVCEILDRLMRDEPDIYKMILYVEQPFPYDIETYPLDVRSVSARKPLFMDESAHDWEFVKRGRDLGWNGVALKTCKTITGALLSLCWAKQYCFVLMVQDLTNPMFAQIPHVGLGAHAGTIMGLESNAMQFYPLASVDEERIHPGLYRRRDGYLDLSSLGDTGFGYRADDVYRASGYPGAGKWREA